VRSDNPSKESQNEANSFYTKTRALAKNGDFNGIGKIVSHSDIGKKEVRAVLGQLCWEANTLQAVLENGTTFKTAVVIMEALFQHKEGVTLLKIGCFSWRGREKSPVSERCLQAALDLGPLDDLYDLAQDWLFASAPCAETQQKKEEYGALAIIKIAERGYRNAFFRAAELMRDGVLCEANLPAAKMYFFRFAARVTLEASCNLKLAGEAFAELLKLKRPKNPLLRNYYSTMSEVAIKASKDLSPLIPGEEFEIILGLPEASKLEFKSTARWNIKEEKVDSEIEHEIVKTIAAFLNTDGGVLVIGIGPNKEELGLDFDYKSLSADKNEDGFKRFLGTLIQNEFGIKNIPLIGWSVIPLRGKEFCRVEVKRSSELVFVKRKAQESLYVRVDNQTIRLTEPTKIEAYRKQRELTANTKVA
jgi:hypothetical protein